MIRLEDAQFEFGAGGGVGRQFQVGGGWTMDCLNFHVNLEMTIDFGTVLDAVNADNFFCGINPIENSVIAHPQLAESGQILRHSNEPTMHHASGIVREPLDFALHARADSGVQPGELSVGLAAYFDLVGHGWWRGFQGLNLPATSSRRATRNSAMTLRFCAVSQS
jgi:hypothetical protein